MLFLSLLFSLDIFKPHNYKNIERAKGWAGHEKEKSKIENG
jgi:hypothetical protein